MSVSLFSYRPSLESACRHVLVVPVEPHISDRRAWQGEQGSSRLGDMRLELQVAGRRISKFAIGFFFAEALCILRILSGRDSRSRFTMYSDISMCLFGSIVTQKL